ncbi:hypothetical protein [Streptomyces sp. NPDC059071]|uniref:hypothetical protein n=1 Tax=unclassified Streptomyces TaxID=2593676 RepID=UPI0036291BEE
MHDDGHPTDGPPLSDDDLDVDYVLTHKNDDLTGGFILLDNELIHDRTLSSLALGLAAHILSLPAGTPIDAESLAERFPEDGGATKIAAALDELEARGVLPL